MRTRAHARTRRNASVERLEGLDSMAVDCTCSRIRHVRKHLDYKRAVPNMRIATEDVQLVYPDGLARKMHKDFRV
jgi:hypothetical protein